MIIQNKKNEAEYKYFNKNHQKAQIAKKLLACWFELLAMLKKHILRWWVGVKIHGWCVHN